MQRIKQQMSAEDCLKILKEEKRGVLSVLGDEGYPYGIPLNHYYNEEDGKLYFHSGKKGHKTDAMNRSDKVSFCTWDEGFVKEGDWALNIRSVIVFGRIRLVEDFDRAMEISRQLSLKFTNDWDYIETEIQKDGRATAVYELIPEHMTGKLVNEK
jgi:nitroimidazol reductase NimA-like FMN-containing flavoprotein (pyridoxamine 5'-phosphate oxidase superfamily)